MESYKERKRQLLYSLANWRHMFLLDEFKKTRSNRTIEEQKQMIKDSHTYAKSELKLHPDWLEMLMEYKVHSVGKDCVNWEEIK